jgi:hypothetical protein
MHSKHQINTAPSTEYTSLQAPKACTSNNKSMQPHLVPHAEPVLMRHAVPLLQEVPVATPAGLSGCQVRRHLIKLGEGGWGHSQRLTLLQKADSATALRGRSMIMQSAQQPPHQAGEGRQNGDTPSASNSHEREGHTQVVQTTGCGGWNGLQLSPSAKSKQKA